MARRYVVTPNNILKPGPGDIPPELAADVRRWLEARRNYMGKPHIPHMDAHDMFARLVPNDEVRGIMLAAGHYRARQQTGVSAMLEITPKIKCRIGITLQGDGDVQEFMFPNFFQNGKEPLQHPDLAALIAPYLAVVQRWENLLAAWRFVTDWEKIRDVAQYNYFFPWLGDIVRELFSSAGGLDRHKRTWPKLMAPILENRAPKDIPAMPRHLLHTCRDGAALLAMCTMMGGDKSSYGDTPPGMCSVTIDFDRIEPTVDFSELRDDNSWE